MKDRTKQVFGWLEVTGFAYKRAGINYWYCRCKCGNITEVAERNLDGGRTRSCGKCGKYPPRKRTPAKPGLKFGRLKLLEFSHKDTHSNYYWKCECECGNITIAKYGDMPLGLIQSCGCLQRNPNLTDEERAASRNIPGYDKWKRAVKQRDNYECQVCGYDEPWALHVHHLNAYHSFHDQRVEIANGMTLCEYHHNDYHSWSELPRGEVTKEDFEMYLTTVLPYAII